MLTRRQFITAAALAPAAGSVLAAPSYAAGKEYLVLNPPAASPRDTIEVVEFFAYTCPHCLQFAPHFERWHKSAPKGVSVRVCPVAWQPKLDPFTQVYFSLEALGLLDKLHMRFFEAVIYQEHPFNYENPQKDILNFMTAAGVDGKKWEQTMRSFSVMNKTRQARQLWQSYQIDSTPMVGVGGLYTTGPHLVGTREATPACIDYLVEQVRRQRG
ncbi:thiol:disulfide interchange protein DsbA/DsbL [Sutterella sp.]|uniref:thiol:disulfide interchange protein DsbA/DsbL n=1 Tax=Sutterella sp. TaxID=1981025 RepID=UPI0026E09C08|nr:thiol:disulfide interchange protein DsbA/DsbL [Sutterella sp.]MDO5530499.1 thiol:disulfide interchange protein DsbA/DsbL [Sutterella sp.]